MKHKLLSTIGILNFFFSSLKQYRGRERNRINYCKLLQRCRLVYVSCANWSENTKARITHCVAWLDCFGKQVKMAIGWEKNISYLKLISLRKHQKSSILKAKLVHRLTKRMNGAMRDSAAQSRKIGDFQVRRKDKLLRGAHFRRRQNKGELNERFFFFKFGQKKPLKRHNKRRTVRY